MKRRSNSASACSATGVGVRLLSLKSPAVASPALARGVGWPVTRSNAASEGPDGIASSASAFHPRGQHARCNERVQSRSPVEVTMASAAPCLEDQASLPCEQLLRVKTREVGEPISSSPTEMKRRGITERAHLVQHLRTMLTMASLLISSTPRAGHELVAAAKPSKVCAQEWPPRR